MCLGVRVYANLGHPRISTRGKWMLVGLADRFFYSVFRFRWRIFLPRLSRSVGRCRLLRMRTVRTSSLARHRCRLSAAQVDNPWLSIFFRALLNQTLPLVVLLLLEWAFSEPINEIIFHGRFSSK